MSPQSRPQPAPLGPGSLVWRVGGDWTALLGGGRALLLQVGHPAVAAGIEQFSNYRGDPWKRLLGTLELYMRTVFGGSEDAGRAGAELRARHRGIQGIDATGARYHALAPEPFTWVHATLVDSLIETVDRFQRPLGLTERQQIYTEMTQVGRLYGLRARDLPSAWPDFVAYRDAMVADRLHMSRTVNDVLDSLVRLPPPRWLRRVQAPWLLATWPASQISRLVALGTLPPAFRERLPIEWTAGDERALRVLQTSIRVTVPRLPLRLRLMPPAYGALRREPVRPVGTVTEPAGRR